MALYMRSDILKELKKRSSDRGETIEFDVNQLRNKFKKCVGDCRKIALTIKTATGIKKIQREKGYGSWFDSYSPLLKRAIPASLKKPQSLQQTIRMRNKLVMSLMMTVMMLQQRKNMFQLDQRKK